MTKRRKPKRSTAMTRRGTKPRGRAIRVKVPKKVRQQAIDTAIGAAVGNMVGGAFGIAGKIIRLRF